MEHWAGYNRTDGTLGRLDDGESWAGAGQEFGSGDIVESLEAGGASGVRMDIGARGARVRGARGRTALGQGQGQGQEHLGQA
jgi:hypothetical protein